MRVHWLAGEGVVQTVETGGHAPSYTLRHTLSHVLSYGVALSERSLCWDSFKGVKSSSSKDRSPWRARCSLSIGSILKTGVELTVEMIGVMLQAEIMCKWCFIFQAGIILTNASVWRVGIILKIGILLKIRSVLYVLRGGNRLRIRARKAWSPSKSFNQTRSLSQFRCVNLRKSWSARNAPSSRNTPGSNPCAGLAVPR